MVDFNSILHNLTTEISVIPTNKKYWLIRTQSGSLYNNFIENDFVGIDRKELSIRDLANLRSNYPNDEDFKHEIKKSVTKFYKGKKEQDDVPQQKIGLISGQIFNFYTNVKSGDIVIIPSEDSHEFSFGVITESFITEFTDEEKRKLGDLNIPCLSKRVRWINKFCRRSLDPNIFRMFTAHYAINNVTRYAYIIERTLRDLYILDDIAHLIVNVQQTNDIKAKDLFGLGYSLMELVDLIASDLNIEGVNSDDLEVTVNLNSPGKINLKSKVKPTIIFAGFILFICGGGYISSDGTSIKTEGIRQLIDAIADYQDRSAEREAKKEDRELKMKMFQKYGDSLNIKNVEDMIKIMKQVDSNKDLPK